MAIRTPLPNVSRASEDTAAAAPLIGGTENRLIEGNTETVRRNYRTGESKRPEPESSHGWREPQGSLFQRVFQHLNRSAFRDAAGDGDFGH